MGNVLWWGTFQIWVRDWHCDHFPILSLRLQFTCTNNIVEYEVVLLGLEAVKSRGIQKLIVIGDSDLVVSQHRETFDTKDEKLKPYKERVTQMLKGFNDISLQAFNRSFNDVANTLVVAASTSTIIPHDVARKGRCIIDTIHRPSIPDYEEH